MWYVFFKFILFYSSFDSGITDVQLKLLTKSGQANSHICKQLAEYFGVVWKPQNTLTICQ